MNDFMTENDETLYEIMLLSLEMMNHCNILSHRAMTMHVIKGWLLFHAF